MQLMTTVLESADIDSTVLENVKYGNCNIFNLTIILVNFSFEILVCFLSTDKILRATGVHKVINLSVMFATKSISKVDLR